MECKHTAVTSFFFLSFCALFSLRRSRQKSEDRRRLGDASQRVPLGGWAVQTEQALLRCNCRLESISADGKRSISFQCHEIFNFLISLLTQAAHCVSSFEPYEIRVSFQPTRAFEARFRALNFLLGVRRRPQHLA